MRYQHRYWWQVLILVLWTAVLCVFAYWIEGFEPRDPAQMPQPKPDELSAVPDEVGLWYLAKDIYIDGVHLYNFELEHPLYVLEENGGQLFFALDAAWQKALGFEIDIIRTEKTILLRDTDSADARDLSTGKLCCNLTDSSAASDRGYRIILTDDIPAEAALSDEERLQEEFEAARVELWLDTFPWLENLPFDLGAKLGYSRKTGTREVLPVVTAFLRQADGTAYLPFSWFTDPKTFGWSVWEDGVCGLYISTDPDIAAQSYYSADNASYVEGMAAFMRSVNRKLTGAEALYFAYLFRHEGRVYGVDPFFLMAVARNESTFRKDVVGGGAIGLMQIMPRTGERFGYSVEALYDPHMNIQFGASYLARFLNTYGNPVTALSAYNAGPGKVAGGDYSTVYAEHVLGHQQNILAWMRSNGYSTDFDEGPLAPAKEAAEAGE